MRTVVVSASSPYMYKMSTPGMHFDVLSGKLQTFNYSAFWLGHTSASVDIL